MTGLCALFPHSRRLGRYYMRYLDKNKTNQIDVISGAFCMVRRSALDKTGLLDEDFSCMEKISTSLIVYYNVAIRIIISR